MAKAMIITETRTVEVEVKGFFITETDLYRIVNTAMYGIAFGPTNNPQALAGIKIYRQITGASLVEAKTYLAEKFPEVANRYAWFSK